MFDILTTEVGDTIRVLSGKATFTGKNGDDTVDVIKIALLEVDVNCKDRV